MSQKIKSLDQDNVKFLCGLIRNIASIDSAINDLVIATDKVWSSKKYTDYAQEIKHDLEAYIQSSINGLTHLKKKIVDTLPSDADAEENILYLVKDTSVVDDVVYNQYLLIDGVLEPLGATSTDISNYYNKDESDAKFALLSNLQTLIDMVGNASDLETTKKDTLVNAINEIKEGLDSIDIDNCITKENIATSLDDTVTDEQVLSAKLYHDEKNTMLIIGYAPEHQGQTLIDLIDAKCTKNFAVYHVVFNGLVIDKPNNERCVDGYCDVYTYIADLHKKIIVHDVAGDAIYERTQLSGVWGDWVTIFSRNNDVVRTNLTGTSSNYPVTAGYYEVIDNVCYVTLRVDVQRVSPQVEQLLTTLPLPKISFENSVPCTTSNGTSLHYVFYTDRGLYVLGGEVGKYYIFSFSYPVADDWRP